ncbi:outer membrane beta-barrel protein [Longimicrobium sp.]|uniref:outer membrane beta-barrel protein n=1 Tax=Longimicrobium sp. TaxID=2029185 RepID=UPI002E340B5B|nr:outer membrane beta-barrel protein [Longimicrobium sp.]HEX6042573.1 outer membrane beta-barrel protein [Longimicrobium sp.]
MQIRFLAAAAAAVLAFSAPLRAQDADSAFAPNGLRPGAWSLSFAAPGSGSGERATLGAWRMVGARTNLGVTLGLALSDSERDDDGQDTEETDTSLQLGINARRYLALTRGVAPYVQGGVFAGTSTQQREVADFEDRVESNFVGAEVAVGAEWFPVRQFSVAGHTGLRALRSQAELSATNPADDENVDASGTGISTFTSALSLQIYF